MDSTADRPTVFISYSHADAKWLKSLNTMLAPVVRAGIASVWWDGKFKPSQLWRQEIEDAITKPTASHSSAPPDTNAPRSRPRAPG